MSGKRFTLEQVLEATRAVVEEKGDSYVYPTTKANPYCVYADVKGNPSCLVGHVVNRLDPEAFEQLRRSEVAARSLSIGADAIRFRGWIPQNFWGDDADAAMIAAQCEQDSGEPWGHALYAAENLGADAD